MTPFLKTVAHDIYTRLGGNLENTAIIFPNKRASLFFNQYLLEIIGDKAMWSPAYITISELFEQFSDSIVADPILLVSKLHKEYTKHTGSNDTLDNFYYWGEMLIKDFDDVDKNLANAAQLFANIKDLRAMGTAADILDEEQKRAVQQFFTNFKPEAESEIKEKFTKTWEVLYPIYTSYKESLRKESLAYEGMLYRDVIENCATMQFPRDKYIFIGFNALNSVETKLFDIIKKEGKALFYWDYDQHYTSNLFHEAGHFMRKNLARFPNALEQKECNHLAGNKNITIATANTDNIQTRYIPTWLKENLSSKEIETAIVLCDETMLEATLHSLPDKSAGCALEHLNVTMGYPISHTPVFSLVKMLVELQVRGYNKKQESYTLAAVEKILKHPYIIYSSDKAAPLREKLLKEKRFLPTSEELCTDEILSAIFTRPTDNAEWMRNIATLIYAIANDRANINEKSDDLYEELFCEAMLKAHNQTQRLLALLTQGEIELQPSSLGSLLLRVMSSLSVPFHGEPVVGLQIMGLLETRNLDFKNIIILGANEGNIPKSSSDNSFIPYNLRRAFGLTMSEHRDSIYSYYFYRLLQRAENVTIVYNSSTESKTKGECSRYLLQLIGSNLYDIKRIKLQSAQNNVQHNAEAVEKNDAIMQALLNRFDTSTNPKASLLTPSGINRFLDCGLKFFFYYILGLKEYKEEETELQANDIGTIFHAAAENLYNHILTTNNGTIDKSDLEKYIKTPQFLHKFINDAFIEHFFNNSTPPVYNGEQLISRDVLNKFLLRLVELDNAYTPFKYLGSEKIVRMPYTVKRHDGKEIKVSIGGTIDRIDSKNGTLNIIDYKTGGGRDDTKTSLDDIFAHNGTSSGYRFQAFLYSLAVEHLLSDGKNYSGNEELEWIEEVRRQGISKIAPSLLYIHKNKASREDYIIDSEGVAVNNISTIRTAFFERLHNVLSNIFDPTKPFEPTQDKERCKFCDYKGICCRQ